MANYENANYTFGTNGVIIPDTADIQTTVQNEYLEAFGADLSLEEATPQGRLIDIETSSRVNTLNFCAAVANSLINISSSSGPALDAWGANFNIERVGASASQVTATVTGVADTVIPEGSEAQDINGLIWRAESEIVIGTDGTATGTFICSQTGAVSLGIGELNTIVASSTLGIDGWETITNNVAAVLGSDIESDYSFLNRILNGIFNGTALFGNYKSVVEKVDNVTDVFTYDNPYNVALTLDNITIPGHSVYVCVEGGSSDDIASALYKVKSAGAGWSGNTTVVVTDENYNTKNTVTFQRASEIAFEIVIDITNVSNSSESLSDDVKSVLTGYFQSGYINYPKPTIRGIVDPYTIGALIKSQIDGIMINKIQIGLTTVTPHAIATVIKASQVGGLTWASIVTSTFDLAVSSQNGTYNFIYNGTNWTLNGADTSLSDYGISTLGTPITGDKIKVLFSNGTLSESPIQVFASEIPNISTTNITVNIDE